MIALAVVLLVVALFTAVVGALAWSKRLPGNPVVGIRVPEVRKSQILWDSAHRIAGPFWTLAGGSLALGAVVAVSASGWMWLLVVAAIIAWLVFLGMGAGIAAHTVALLDAQTSASAQDGCCSSGNDTSGSATLAATDPAADCGVTEGCGSCALQGCCEGDSEAFPSVDLDAARRAAAASDS